MATTRTIKTQLEIAGEQAYTQAMQNCKDKMSMLNSEMRLASAQYDGQRNSLEALSRNGELLSQKYDIQKQKVEGLKTALQSATDAQSAYASKIQEYQSKVDAAQKEMEDLQNSSEDTAEAQEKLREEIDRLIQKQEEAQRGYDRASDAVDEYQKALNNAEAALIKTGRAIEENNGYLEEARNSADGTAISIDGFGKKTAEAGEQSGLLGKIGSQAFAQIAAAFSAAGIISMLKKLGQAYMEALDASAKFETSLAKIATIANTSAVSLDDIANDVLHLSSSLGVSAEEISESVYQAISAGVDTASAVDFVNTATRLSVGGFTTASTAVDTLTTILNAYGKELSATEHVSDVLITTQNLGKTSVDSLGGSIGKVIPVAAAYEVSLENVAAAYAELTASGIATEEAGTSLKAMLNELGDSGSEVGRILEEETGKSFLGLMSSGASLGDVMAILGGSVNNNAAEFAQLWSSTEAGTAALSLLKSGADEFNNTLLAMLESTGAAEEAYNTMADTAEQASARAQTAWENLWKTIINPEAKTAWANWWADIWNSLTLGIENSNRVVQLQDEMMLKRGAINEAYRAGTISAADAQAQLNAITQEYSVLIDQAYSGQWRMIEARQEEQDAVNESYERLEELWDAYDGSAESVENLIEFTYEETEASRQLALAFEDEITAIESVKAQMQELEERYAAAKDAAYESISATVGSFEMFDATATMSIENVVAALNSQIEWVNNYSANLETVLQTARDNGVTLSAELVSALTAGTTESAALAAGLAQSGIDGINQLNTSYANLETGKNTFSTICAEITTNHEQTMADLKQQLADAVTNFNQSAAMYENVRTSFYSADSAAKTGIDTLNTTMYNGGRSFVNSWNAGVASAGGLNTGIPGGSLGSATPGGSFRSIAMGSISAFDNLRSSVSAPHNSVVVVGDAETQKMLGDLVKEIRGMREEQRNTGIYLNGDTLVGELTDTIDKKLGQRYDAAMRGDMV